MENLEKKIEMLEEDLRIYSSNIHNIGKTYFDTYKCLNVKQKLCGAIYIFKEFTNYERTAKELMELYKNE